MYYSEAGLEFGDRLEEFEARIYQQLSEAKKLVARRDAGEKIEDFDIRGNLYASGMELAPLAREGDIAVMREWLHLKGDENVADLAAGGGFLTRRIREWTTGEVIAVDPAQQQLDYLERATNGTVEIIVGSPDSEQAMLAIPDGSLDVVTSFGGLHHVGDQRMMMEQVARMLKTGGRFMAGDVGDKTALSHHFDAVTAVKSVTGHTATWLSEGRLQELINGLPLKVTKAENVPLKWIFASEKEMALFFKGLHGYDQPNQEILTDLKEALGYEQGPDGKFGLNWPMLFFEIEKQ